MKNALIITIVFLSLIADQEASDRALYYLHVKNKLTEDIQVECAYDSDDSDATYHFMSVERSVSMRPDQNNVYVSNEYKSNSVYIPVLINIANRKKFCVSTQKMATTIIEYYNRDFLEVNLSFWLTKRQSTRPSVKNLILNRPHTTIALTGTLDDIAIDVLVDVD